jgi:hypothetical protein
MQSMKSLPRRILIVCGMLIGSRALLATGYWLLYSVFVTFFSARGWSGFSPFTCAK